jgi:AcrR family transcriptional regulator
LLSLPYPDRVTLRDRKRERTRQAVLAAATDLFERQGFEATTVADIAAAADIGTRTFFSYFPTKEDLLVPGADDRVRTTRDAIASRRPDEGPMDVLLRSLADVLARPADGDGMVDRLAALRTRMFRTEPAVRGKLLQIQHSAGEEIAGLLVEAFPDRLDRVSAGATVGAFLGAVQGALEQLLDGGTVDRAELRTRLEQAVRSVLRP